METFYQKMTSAYKSGKTEILQEALSQISNRIDRLDWNEYAHLVGALSRAFNESFLHVKAPRYFPTTVALNQYLEHNVETAKFLGRSEVVRRGHEGTAVTIECLTLRQLGRYREKYRESGNVEFARIAESAYASWLAHIESKEGFSRIAAQRQLALSLARIEEVGDMTRELAYKSARCNAQGLINCGYTPTWLDSEFPPPMEK